MNNSRTIITLTSFKYKEYSYFAIHSSNDTVLKNIAATQSAIKWHPSKKTFYVAQKKLSLAALFTLFRKHDCYVDYSSILDKPKKLPSKKKNKDKRALSEENKQVIRDFVRYLQGLRLSKNTIKVYFTFVADFVAFIKSKPLNQLNNTDARLFIENTIQSKKYAISTHRQLISALKHFGTFLPESNLIVENFKRPSKSKYLPTVLSKEEIIDLLRATKNLKHRTILALLYSAGLRISELLNLELRHIDVDRRQLLIKNAKGRKDRVVILAESFIPLYQNYFLTYQPVRFFVENPKGGNYSAESIRKFLKMSCHRAHITKRVTPHTLRHSFATHLIENGVGLRYVQDLLGHSKPETTMIYTHVAKKDLLKIESPLDSAFIALSQTDKSNRNVRLSQNLNG